MSSSQRILLMGGALAVLLVIGGILYAMSGGNTRSTVADAGKTESTGQYPGAAVPPQNPPPTTPSASKTMGHLITLNTNMGTIQFRMYDTDAPKAAGNFVTLAQKGFYDNLIFHRVIKGFMIQGGDPKGDGTGGPGYTFADELNSAAASYQEGYKKGVVAMANAGPDTNGSQFFIMLEDYSLPHSYTIFGHVVKGQDVVDAIGSVKTGTNDRPVQPVTIKSVKVEEISQ